MHLNSATYLYIKHISAFPLFYGAAVLMLFSAFSEYINCLYMKTLLLSRIPAFSIYWLLQFLSAGHSNCNLS